MKARICLKGVIGIEAVRYHTARDLAAEAFHLVDVVARQRVSLLLFAYVIAARRIM